MLRVRVVILCLFALAPAAAAQTPTGSIDGIVVDSSGAVVPGATVVVTHQPTGVAREVVTDAQGHFRAPLLPVGPYTVSAALPGFQPFESKGLPLTIGETLSIRIELKLGGVAESVTVHAPISAT